MQEDLVNFSSLKTISIAKPSTQINLVDRIFETSNEFNRQRVIVTFIKPNANIPLSSSEGEINKAESDSQEQQQNDRIVNINPLLLLPFQKARSALNSSIKKNYKFIVVSKLRAPSTTFGANSVKLIEMRRSQRGTMLFFNGGSSRLIVKYIYSSNSEGAHSPPITFTITQVLNCQRLIVTSIRDKIPFNFCDEQIVFFKEEWEKKDDSNVINKQNLIGLAGQISLVGHIRLDGIIGLVGQTGLIGLVGQIGSVDHIGLIGLIKPICFIDLNSLFIQISVDHDQLIVATTDTKISLHLCNYCGIFCEGEWMSMTTNTRGGAIKWIVSISCFGLVSLVGLSGINGVIRRVSLISKNGFISLGLVGFTGLGLGSLVISISFISLVGLIGFIGLVGFMGLISLIGVIGLSLISHNVGFIGLGVSFLKGLDGLDGIIGLVCLIGHMGLVGCISLNNHIRHKGLVGNTDLIGPIGLIGLVGQNGLVGFIGLELFGLVGHIGHIIGLNGLNDFTLVGLSGPSAIMGLICLGFVGLISLSLVSLVGLNGHISLIGLGCFSG